MVDYSQYGQALIIQQLISPDTPRTLIDIGANDGVTGSNSRALLEQGWRGILVEPLPSVYEHLKLNSAVLPNATVVNSACSDRRGTATLRIGADGCVGQMSSLSEHPLIEANLSTETVKVETLLLSDLIHQHSVPDDFGILLIDTEGHDMAVLTGLDATPARPRIIVTEDFVATNEDKYAFLRTRGYIFAGAWGSDSMWVHKSHTVDLQHLRYPVSLRPREWQPVGQQRPSGSAMFDLAASSTTERPFALAGWAWTGTDSEPPQDITVRLLNERTHETYNFAAWRTPRPDVSAVFGSERLVMSGFRAFVDVPPGEYLLTIIQQDGPYWTSHAAAAVQLAV